MTNPYQIESPALISFSGGRTSGYMLRHILDAYAGQLPAGIVACFANTGNEMLETLDFVRDCSQRWNVDIVWLEFSPDGEKQRKFRVVDHPTASRQGQPCEELLRERKYLPNPVTRFCTTTLLCGRTHKSSYVFALVMWRAAAVPSGFQVSPRDNAT
jgi:3'-phosphoadenosine 5'-phosphosulfate sulfotransferase (PAPS reductase)/FAD synthetase